MRAAARRTASWVDAALVAVRELLKAWVNEVFHLGSSLATAFTVLVMLAFHRPGVTNYLAHRRRLESTRPRCNGGIRKSAFMRLLNEVDVSRERTADTSPDADEPRLSRHGSLEFAVEADAAQNYSAHGSAGFFEELRLRLLLSIHRTVDHVRLGLTHVMSIVAAHDSSLQAILYLLNPLNWLRLFVWCFAAVFVALRTLFSFRNPFAQKIEQWRRELDYFRNKEELVKSSGYPYEKYQVTTADGYVLTLERIPRRTSSHVAFLQHGVFDSSFAWIATGSSSLAFRAYDMGLDVWMGNFRGAADEAHTTANLPSSQFWSFTVNEHAFQDIPAFIQKIREVKATESAKTANPSEKASISIVAHSMGAACALMFIIYARMREEPHHLRQAILLSPAGYHERVPFFVPLLGPILDFGVRLLRIHVFRFPGDLFRILVAKVLQDLGGVHSMKELVGLVTSKVVGGRPHGHTIFRSPALPYNIFSGTPVGVMRHFRQLVKAKRLQGYDYGAEGNRRAYGTASPPDFSGNFDKIDLPVHFLCGTYDTLIEPVNVIRQYTMLADTRPELAHLKSFPHSAHLDFTIGLDDDMINYILRQLRPPA